MVTNAECSPRQVQKCQRHAIFKKKPELSQDLQADESKFGPWESHRARPLQEEKPYSLLNQTTQEG